MPESALVLGGSGYIAYFLVDELLRRGWRVTSVSRREPPGDHGAGSGLRHLRGSVGDRELLDAALVGVDAVFPLMGSPGPGRGFDDPVRECDEVLRTHLQLLAAMSAASSTARVVVPGSRLQYGVVAAIPVHEDVPLAPVDVYGTMKTAAEHAYVGYGAARGLAVVPLRITNVFGPELPGHAARTSSVFSRFVAMAEAGETIRMVGGGSALRDFVHVRDLVDLMVRAATAPGVVGTPVNAGSGRGRSLRSVAETVVAAVGRGRVADAPWPTGTPASSEAADFVADVARAERLLGWRAATTVEDELAARAP